jgi:hypothetical protein
MACLTGFSVACSSPSDDADNTTEKKPEHIWQDQVDTLDKARGVEKTLLDVQKQRDEALRQQQ